MSESKKEPGTWHYRTPQRHKTYYCIEDVTTALFDAGITWDDLAKENTAATHHIPDFSNWIEEFKQDRNALQHLRHKLGRNEPIPPQNVPMMHTLDYVSQRLQFCMDQLHQWMHGNEIFMCRRSVPGDKVEPSFALSKYRHHAPAVVTAELPRNLPDYTLGAQDEARQNVAIAVPEHESCKQMGSYLIAPITHPISDTIYNPDLSPLHSSPSLFPTFLATTNASGPYYQESHSSDDVSSIGSLSSDME